MTEAVNQCEIQYLNKSLCRNISDSSGLNGITYNNEGTTWQVKVRDPTNRHSGKTSVESTKVSIL